MVFSPFVRNYVLSQILKWRALFWNEGLVSIS